MFLLAFVLKSIDKQSVPNRALMSRVRRSVQTPSETCVQCTPTCMIAHIIVIQRPKRPKNFVFKQKNSISRIRTCANSFLSLHSQDFVSKTAMLRGLDRAKKKTVLSTLQVVVSTIQEFQFFMKVTK